MDFRAPPIKSIADFLLYLFQDRKLQPSNIDGHRSAIAGKLGNSPVNVSKDENVTCLLEALDLQDCLLLDLGSGKCRSEIHAWLHKNIRHQSDWSKVSLYPSPSFLSKNQLAKEGPGSVAPVVILALAPTLEK